MKLTRALIVLAASLLFGAQGELMAQSRVRVTPYNATQSPQIQTNNQTPQDGVQSPSRVVEQGVFPQATNEQDGSLDGSIEEVNGYEGDAIYESVDVPAFSNSFSMGTILVNEVGDARTIMGQINSKSKSRYVRGYRIGVFFDNGQSARVNAVSTRDRFVEYFPDIRVYINYENPYFRVVAGNLLTEEEAVIMLERIRGKFPRAFILRDNIPMSVL